MSIKSTLVLFLLLFTIKLFSQGYYIQNYDVDIVLQEDGSLDITEDITVDFEQKKQGIIRNIPYVYQWQGKRITFDIKNIDVTGYDQKITNKANEKIVRIGTKGKFITGIHEYKIKYTVTGAIAAYEDFIELYWNVIPDGWDTRIESFSYSLALPKDVALAYDDYKIYSGDHGSTDNTATIIYSDNTISGRSTNPLKAKQGVTLAVKLPDDYVPASLISDSVTNMQSKDSLKLFEPWTLLFSVMTFILAILGYRKIDRNQSIVKDVEDQYYPPENMSAAQVGYFIDHSANDRDIMALIPQWGSEGLIKLEKVDDDTKISKTGNLPPNLPDYEHTLFDAIFSEGDVVYLNSLKYKIAGSLSSAKFKLFAEQKASDLYDETSIKYFHSYRTLIAGFLLIAGLGVTSILVFQSLTLCITFVLLGILLLTVYFTEPKLSDTGIRIKNHLFGLKQFLENHDGSKYPALMREDPKYFDNIFPYVVSLGIDMKFLQKFSDHVDYSPNWYLSAYGINNYNTAPNRMKDFSQNFDIKEITSVFSSVDNTGGTSGGGGGFSGGGGGGGGGSSW